MKEKNNQNIILTQQRDNSRPLNFQGLNLNSSGDETFINIYRRKDKKMQFLSVIRHKTMSVPLKF